MSGSATHIVDELAVLSAEPLCAQAPLTAFDTWVTPTSRFFIRNHFAIPDLDVAVWRVNIEGQVERPLSLGYEDLKRLPSKELVCLLECAGNSRTTAIPPVEGLLWEHGGVGTARWKGVPLHLVLEQASPKASAREVLFEGVDRGTEPGQSEPSSYSMSVSLEKALHPDTLLALEMNGEPLPRVHGYPVRVIIPGWYGMASVKWLSRIQVIDHAFQGHFRVHSYVFIREGDEFHTAKEPVTSMLVKSLITWPSRGQVVPVGEHVVRGVAWSGRAPVAKVEVSTCEVSSELEGTTWHSATLLEPTSTYAWQRWESLCQAARPGYYVVRARATDAQGNTQPAQAEWNFRGVGINSIHAVPLEVRPTQ